MCACVCTRVPIWCRFFSHHHHTLSGEALFSTSYYSVPCAWFTEEKLRPDRPSVPPFSRANSGAPNSACTPPPFRSCAARVVCRSPVPCSARGLATPSSLPRRCAPKGCVCVRAHLDIAMRGERDAPPRRGGGAGVCVCVWRTEQRQEKRGGAVDLSAWCRPRLLLSFARAHILHAPTRTPTPRPPRSPLHYSLSLSRCARVRVCRVGISGRAPSSTPPFQVGR